MTYRSVIVEPAEVDVDQIYAYILARSPQGATSWYRAFVARTKRIALQPLACSLAPENAEFDFQLRQALFRTRYGAPYRCVFTVVGDEVRMRRSANPTSARSRPGAAQGKGYRPTVIEGNGARPRPAVALGATGSASAESGSDTAHEGSTGRASGTRASHVAKTRSSPVQPPTPHSGVGLLATFDPRD
jgi:plasmid stabilization system protein ParE